MISTAISIGSFLMAVGGAALAINNHIDTRQDRTDKAIMQLDARLEVLITGLTERGKLVDYRLTQLESGATKNPNKYQRI